MPSPTTPPSRIDVMREFVPGSPLVRHLGIELVALEPDRAELRLPYASHLPTLADVVHGGAIASLIDTAGMASTWAVDEPAESLRGSTITLNVEYLAAAHGRDLTAVSVAVKRGRSICFNEVHVTEPDGRLVARGSVVQQLG
ncbi:hypothetical protein DSM112329_00942 [Paraconexibacter sp. AEG42_29]|uniref:Thioesterase domain-containing protein n=1 Tax=Paraconexibacter sp. AEG42_29 TaxID=2997339 RepID=A0AAU7AR77_9ACTN